jgi:hypothetical protein
VERCESNIRFKGGINGGRWAGGLGGQTVDKMTEGMRPETMKVGEESSQGRGKLPAHKLATGLVEGVMVPANQVDEQVRCVFVTQ